MTNILEIKTVKPLDNGIDYILLHTVSYILCRKYIAI